MAPKWPGPPASRYPARVHDGLPLLLLLLAAIIIVVQARSLTLQRQIARTNQAAALREEDRQVAAYARALHAVEGEQGARELLARAGYAVLARQVPGSWTVRADGEATTFGLRADYLVARDGRRYIAEIKTGRLATRLSHGPTRRQLLEYSAAFDVDGVILVDADAGSVVEVDVNLPARDRARGLTPAVVATVALVTFAAGVVVGDAVRGGRLHDALLQVRGLPDPRHSASEGAAADRLPVSEARSR